MGWIALEGIHFYAYHGFYEEERLLGNEFVVDVYVKVDDDWMNTGDELDNTLNYESLFSCCREVIKGEPKKLIESLAADICNKIKTRHREVGKVRIKISKNNPALAGKVDRSVVEMEL